ncbi:MAG: PAS domain S-box protein [Smithellaceae bacterium]|jgi:PAS domain S-box-containing protein
MMQDKNKTKEQLINELAEIRRQVVELEKSLTEPRQTAEALHKSEAILRSVFKATPVGIAVMKDRVFQNANKVWLENLGYSESEVIGRPPRILYKDQEEYERVGRELFTNLSEKGLASVQTKFRRKDGAVRDIILTSVPLHPVDLSAGAVVAFEDVTDRKRAKNTLQELERRLVDIVDFLPDATLVRDLQGRIIVWNKAIEDMTGAKAENMLGKGDYEYALPFYGKRRPMMIDLVLKPDKKIERKYDMVIKQQGHFLIAEGWASLKGKRVFLWGKASPFCNSKGKIVGSVESVRDITDRKQYEDAINKREKELGNKTCELEDMNAALRVLLKQRESDRKEFEEKILTNIKVLILPHIEQLKMQLRAGENRRRIEILESNLKEIVSPFARTLSAVYSNLTNREIQIANLIKEEKTTKEITEVLNLSESAVNIHRYRIRQKLNIDKRQNLRTFFSSLS